MRKHFLLLFLMALLPLAGWAADEITAAPEAVENLTYTSEGLNLVAAGEVAEGWTMQYAKSDDGTITGDDLAALGWNAAIPQGDVAGTYFVYYRAFKGGEDPVYGAAPVEVTIAKADAIVYIKADALEAVGKHKMYGWRVDQFDATENAARIADLRYGATAPSGFFDGDEDDVQIIVNWGNDITERVKDEDHFEYYNAGEHTFTLSVNAMNNYNVSLYPSSGKWYVDKKPLTVSAQNTNVIYGEAFVGSNNVVYSGFVPGEDEDIVFGEQQLAWNTTYQDASNPTQKTPSTVVGSPYAWQPSGLTSDNYNITYNNGNITVVAKNIAEGVSINDISDVTYNKDNQKPTTVTGKYGLLDLVAADYELSYLEDITVNAETGVITGTATTDLTNAGEYGVVITGAGNYTGVAYKKFTIKKKDLAVSTGTLEKVYNATNFHDEATAFTIGTTVLFEGFVTGDDYAHSKTTTSGDISLHLEKNGTAVTEAIAAGDYDIKFNDLSGVAFTNYKMNAFGDGKLKIAKRIVRITAKSKSKTYGTADPYKEGVAATKADVTVATTPATEGLLAGDAIATYPTLKRDGADEQGSYDLYLENDATNTLVIENAGHENVTANYDPKFIKGTYTIGEGEIAFRANSVTKTYGQVTVAQANALLTASIVGMPEDLAETIQDKVNGLLYVDVTGLELDDDDLLPAKTAGYSIKFNSFTAADVLTEEMLENYSSDIATFCETAKFVVNKAPLKIEALTQSLTDGMTVRPASSETVKISPETPLAQASDRTVLFGASGISLEFDVNVPTDEGDALDGASAHGWNGTADTGNGIYVGGIVINTAAYEANPAANYTFENEASEAKAGLLTATNGVPVEFDVTAETTEQIEAQVNKLIDAQISLNEDDKEFILYGDEWNAVTLPFDINPLQFCKDINSYAVFDVLQETGTAMNFKMTYETIPAYTPFLVKVKNDVNLSEKTFYSVIVKAIPENTGVANDAYIFQGNLAKCTPEGWLITANSAGAGNITLWNNVGATTKYDCYAFSAYITRKPTTPSTEAPVLYIEEADGSTTAISAIAANGVAVKAEGWYTIDGIRLQGAPTEKGVYINNGKKIVIK